MNNRNILISGAGIAGTTLAYWLKKFGFKPVIVERAPKLREGGYAIDFWGAGYDIAERMSIIPDLALADLKISELTLVDKNDNRKAALNYAKLIELMRGRAFTLVRSDLARIIYQLDQDVEIIFGDWISDIRSLESGLVVTFHSGDVRSFDLVIGADGLHSVVRTLVYGPEAQFEEYYGYYTASYTVKKNLYKGKAFKMFTVPGRQVAVYSTKDAETTAFFIFSSPQKLSYDHTNLEAQKQILRNEFQKTGWWCDELLAAMDTTTDFFFDVVSQIHIEHWWKGRVALVGDACYCPSLLSGQGSTLAMVGAYILAGELKEASGDHQVAFQEYQRIFKPFLDAKQKIAQSFAKSFVPKSSLGIWMRNVVVKLMFLPFVSRLFIKPFLDNNLELKEY
jgi:2-polyprenyl-6-methoxyphenol hydroxylase-like FAD-dependent oxidoreductase